MERVQLTFLHITILLSFLFLGAVVSPFLTTLILSAVLVTGMYPVYEWTLRKVRGSKRLAAGLVSLCIGVIFSLVLFVFILTLSQEALSTYQGLEEWIRGGKLNLNAFVANVSEYFGIPPLDITASISQAAQNFSQTIVGQSANLLKNIVWLILNFFLLVFSMYFFLKDGAFIIQSLENIIPLPAHHAAEIFQKFREVSLAMLYGIFFTAMGQGLLGGLGLWAAGIRNPLFWGTLMALFGMLPVGGTAIVWLPAGLFLLANKSYIAGVGLLVWGGLIVAFVDNIVKPLVIAKQTKTYPLATFLVVIGGLMVFGLKGALIAPMVLASLVTLLHIYKMRNV